MALARVKGQTFNQDPVSLVQPCRKGELGCEAIDVTPKEPGELYVLAGIGVLGFPEPLSGAHCFSGKPLPQPSDGEPGPGLWLAVFINRQGFFVICTLIPCISAGIIIRAFNQARGGCEHPTVCVCVCSPCLYSHAEPKPFFTLFLKALKIPGLPCLQFHTAECAQK